LSTGVPNKDAFFIFGTQKRRNKKMRKRKAVAVPKVSRMFPSTTDATEDLAVTIRGADENGAPIFEIGKEKFFYFGKMNVAINGKRIRRIVKVWKSDRRVMVIPRGNKEVFLSDIGAVEAKCPECGGTPAEGHMLRPRHCSKLTEENTEPLTEENTQPLIN
jgi:hypothetical protein